MDAEGAAWTPNNGYVSKEHKGSEEQKSLLTPCG